MPGEGAMTNYEEALAPLASKRRTYEDLSRFVGSRAGGIPNYTMLLGAGCSVSSNIRSAKELTGLWRDEICRRLAPDVVGDVAAEREYLTKSQASWYNGMREYSCLFEKSFDLPRQRRMFVEQEVSGKSPNLGYSYLIKLVEKGILNTIFTTNFDDLINEAFFQFSGTRPIVCAHDSSASSLSVTSQRPKIIKLHGDYLFDDIKATVRETESLEENTRKKFVEFGRDFGLIVVGYGGGDRSVMDVLQYLLRSDDYFKHGVYWCIRKGDHLSEDLLKLLWRDRVYFVEIDGFDELMAQLHHDVLGDELPIDTSIINKKPESIIKGFCDNPYLRASASIVIKRDLDRLQRQVDREQLLSVFRDFGNKSKSDEDRDADEVLKDTEFAVLLRIKELMALGSFDDARERLRGELARASSRKYIEDIRELQLQLEEQRENSDAAIEVIDAMIAEDPHESENYLRKAEFVEDLDEQMAVLELAASMEPSNHRVYNAMARCLFEKIKQGVGSLSEAQARVEQVFSLSTKADPGPRNAIWDLMVDYYPDAGLANDEVRRRLGLIISSCSSFGPDNWSALNARLQSILTFSSDHYSGVEADTLVADFASAVASSPRVTYPGAVWAQLGALSRLRRTIELERRLVDVGADAVLAERPEYLRFKADFDLDVNGDLSAAIACIERAVAPRRKRVDILRLADLYSWSHDAHALSKLIDEYGAFMKPSDLLTIKRAECSARKDYEGELALFRSSARAGKQLSLDDRIAEVHLLLQLSRWSDAAHIAKEELDERSWNKISCGALIINYELAMLRDGKAVSKNRLRELTEFTNDNNVKICAYYLLGDLEKARELARSAIKTARRNAYIFGDWAIFADERGQAFLKPLLMKVIEAGAAKVA